MPTSVRGPMRAYKFVFRGPLGNKKGVPVGTPVGSLAAHNKEENEERLLIQGQEFRRIYRLVITADAEMHMVADG